WCRSPANHNRSADLHYPTQIAARQWNAVWNVVASSCVRFGQVCGWPPFGFVPTFLSSVAFCVSTHGLPVRVQLLPQLHMQSACTFVDARPRPKPIAPIVVSIDDVGDSWFGSSVIHATSFLWTSPQSSSFTAVL